MSDRVPSTTAQNVVSRLFLRFFLCYFAGCMMALLLCSRLEFSISRGDVGLSQFLFIPLALLSAFLTLGKPYALVLTGVKAFYDVSLLRALVSVFRTVSNGFLAFNAGLLYVIFSLVLFCMASVRALLFACDVKGRDLQLIFSRRFAVFLGEVLLFTALALSLYYLWPSLLSITGL